MLSNKQTAFLQAMLEQPTLTKAAAKAGITRKTAYNYMKQPAFLEELDKRRTECISDTVRYMQGKLSLCSETLVSIIENPGTGQQIKINAIQTLLNACKQFTETAEVIARLQNVEDLLKKGADDEI